MNGVAAPRVSAESRCWPARRSRNPHSFTTTGWMPARAARRLTPFALLAGLLAPAAAGAQSAEPEAVPRLDPVVVTVTRIEQKASEAPAAVTVLTARGPPDPRRARPLDDLLRQVPGLQPLPPVVERGRPSRPRRACRCAASGPAGPAARSCSWTTCPSTTRSAAGSTGTACRCTASSASRSCGAAARACGATTRSAGSCTS